MLDGGDESLVLDAADQLADQVGGQAGVLGEGLEVPAGVRGADEVGHGGQDDVLAEGPALAADDASVLAGQRRVEGGGEQHGRGQCGGGPVDPYPCGPVGQAQGRDAQPRYAGHVSGLAPGGGVDSPVQQGGLLLEGEPLQQGVDPGGASGPGSGAGAAPGGGCARRAARGPPRDGAGRRHGRGASAGSQRDTGRARRRDQPHRRTSGHVLAHGCSLRRGSAGAARAGPLPVPLCAAGPRARPRRATGGAQVQPSGRGGRLSVVRRGSSWRWTRASVRCPRAM